MTIYEHPKYGGPVLWDILSKLYLLLFISCDVPSQFRTFRTFFILSLFKGKGAKTYNEDNYRGTAMFSVFCKVFEMIFLRQVEKTAEVKGYFFYVQFGFREGVSCLDASFVISESMNHLIERRGKAFACFLDVRKAFVSINSLLYKLKRELGIDPKMWLIIKELFSGLKGQVIFSGHLSSSFSTSQGSGQERILAPFMYKVYVNQLLMELCQLDIGITLFNYNVSALSFEDDMTLIACFRSCLNTMIQLAYTYSCSWRYQFNYGKTGVVIFGECAVIHFKNMKVRQWKVGPNHNYEKYEYVNLGVFKNHCRSFDKTIVENISKARKKAGILC